MTKAPKGWLPPDPENMNGDRAEWADVAIVAFERETGTERGDALADLLGDLLHWCDRNEQNFCRELARAVAHYTEETNRKGEQARGLALRAPRKARGWRKQL